MSDHLIDGPVPRHNYTTVEGSEPGAYVEHDPRVLLHTVTTDQDITAIHMMTEIGDGCFVQWSQCTKCSKSVQACTCNGGPVPPDYILKWLPQRFERSLDARPEPDYKLLDKIISWVRERGYVVKKKGDADPDKDLFIELFKAAALTEPPKESQLDEVLDTFQADYDRLAGRPTGEVVTEPDGETVDAAATFATENQPDPVAAAIDAVKAEKDVAPVDVDF